MVNNIAVNVSNLSKAFTLPATKQSSERKTILAVDDISFSVKKGELIGFIGPNGAGKSTTIKMLTGILYPTSGDIKVAGFNPQKQREQLIMKIGCVFGQRTQLVYNLPVSDSFELFSKLYEIDAKKFKSRKQYLFDVFGINEFLEQPVRKLSLGQRMKSEVALALLHDPEIVFLDEPTIGLDIVAKKTLRETLLKLNKEQGTTIFLTSHDVGDIESLTERTIVVNHGKIVVDQDTKSLKNKYLSSKLINLSFANPVKSFKDKRITDCVMTDAGVEFKLDTTKFAINEVIKDLLNSYEIIDIDISNPSLEDVIRDIYQSK